MRVDGILRVAVAFVVLAGLGPAAAHELRLEDGEIVHGILQPPTEAAGAVHLRVLVGDTERKIRKAEVLEVLAEAVPFPRVVDALQPGAWRCGAGVPLDAAQRWGAPRRRAVAAGGATAASEAAVGRALAWLADHQDADGKIDADRFMKHDPPEAPGDGAGGGHHGERVPCPYDGVTTALALMAWSAAGSTPVSGPYREHVARALAWCRRRLAAGPGGAYGLWNYGLCTQAVVDAYLLRPEPSLAPVVRGALASLLRLQQGDGGWSYYLPVGDVPTTGVVGTALGLAARAGFAVPADAVAALLRFLDARVDRRSGRSEYHAGAERKGYTPTRANTAAALTVRAMLGARSQAPQRGRQLAAVQERPVWKIAFKEVKTRDGRTVRAQIGNLYPYLWYYATCALHEQGGASWSTWFGPLKSALLKGQRQEGSSRGSWDPLGTYSDSGGRAFVTGLCVLMLQAPYRYARLP